MKVELYKQFKESYINEKNNLFKDLKISEIWILLKNISNFIIQSFDNFSRN